MTRPLRRRTVAGDMAAMERCRRRHPQPPCDRCGSKVDAREPSGDLVLCIDENGCAEREQIAIAEAEAEDGAE